MWNVTKNCPTVIDTLFKQNPSNASVTVTVCRQLDRNGYIFHGSMDSMHEEREDIAG